MDGVLWSGRILKALYNVKGSVEKGGYTVVLEGFQLKLYTDECRVLQTKGIDPVLQTHGSQLN